jgi:oligosaccharide translocation protein RFT1
MSSKDTGTNESKSPTASRFLTGASSLVLLQILTRLVTFLLNQALVRLSTPQIFGTAAIQFELLLTSILFISREGVRLALLRAPDDTSKKLSQKGGDGDGDKDGSLNNTEGTSPARNRKQKRGANAIVKDKEGAPSNTAQDRTLASNIATLPFLVGIPIAVVLSLAYGTTATEETRNQPYFYTSIAAYTISALLQLASEPMYILAQQDLDFSVRMKSEAAGVIFRAAVTVGILSLASNTGKLGQQTVSNGQELGLLAFAMGQLAYGVLVLGIYLWTYRNRGNDWRWWPKSVRTIEKGQ